MSQPFYVFDGKDPGVEGLYKRQQKAAPEGGRPLSGLKRVYLRLLGPRGPLGPGPRGLPPCPPPFLPPLGSACSPREMGVLALELESEEGVREAGLIGPTALRSGSSLRGTV